MAKLLLKSILDDEFLETLAKSADLCATDSKVVLDDLKVVPRAIMSMLISGLDPMKVGESKVVALPLSDESRIITVKKNAHDDYSGMFCGKNKEIQKFENRTIPGLTTILLSKFELYDLENLSKSEDEEIGKKVQRLIDERMELHSLVSRVVEEKLAQREVLHKIMMNKLTQAMSVPTPPIPVRIPEHMPSESGPKTMPLPEKPIEIAAKDIIKKERIGKKGSPLREFVDRKKKPKEYRVEMTKSEAVDCGDCGQTIFGSGVFSMCVCYGQDRDKKIWLKKTEDGIQIKFSRSWDSENIEMLLKTLRSKK